LNGKINMGGSAAKGGGPMPGKKIIGGPRPAEGHIQVGVGIDTPGHHKKPTGIDNLIIRTRLSVKIANGRNFFALYQNIGGNSISRADNSPPPNNGSHISSYDWEKPSVTRLRKAV